MRLIPFIVITVYCGRAAAQTASTPPQQLLAKAIEAAHSRAAVAPNYTCVQTMRRQKCIRPASKVESKCAVCPGDSSLILTRTDEVRVEVGITETGEMFAWPGDKAFRSRDLDALVGGGATSVGEFGSFATSVLLSDTDPSSFQFSGGAFSYQVPSHASHFAIRGRGNHDYITPYGGRIWVDPASGELRKLEVVVTDPPSETALARVEIVVDYNGPAPAHSRTAVRGIGGDMAVNETTYSDCRVFGSESKIIFDVQPLQDTASRAPGGVKLLAGSEVGIALNTPIDSATDFTGRRIEGRLLRALRGPDARVVAPPDTKLNGRILRLERLYCPVSNFILGLTFDEIVLAGGAIPISLIPPDYRPPRRGELETALVPEENRPGVQSFVFRDRDRLKLGTRFVSRWRVGR